MVVTSAILVTNIFDTNFDWDFYNVDGALLNMHASNLQLVSNCFTTAVLPSNKLDIFELNNCLLY